MPCHHRTRTASHEPAQTITVPVSAVAAIALNDDVLCTAPGVAQLAMAARSTMTDAQAVALAEPALTSAQANRRHHAALFVALRGQGTPDDVGVSRFLQAAATTNDDEEYLGAEARGGHAAAALYRGLPSGERMEHFISRLIDHCGPGIGACFEQQPPPVTRGGLAIACSAWEPLRVQLASSKQGREQLTASLQQLPMDHWSAAVDRMCDEQQIAPTMPTQRVEEALAHIYERHPTDLSTLMRSVLQARTTMTDAAAIGITERVLARHQEQSASFTQQGALYEFLMIPGTTAIRDRSQLTTAMRACGADDDSFVMSTVALVTAIGRPSDDATLATQVLPLSLPMAHMLIDRAATGRLAGAAVVGAIEQAAECHAQPSLFTDAARRIPAFHEWIDEYVAVDGYKSGRVCERALAADIPVSDASLGRLLLADGRDRGWHDGPLVIAERLATRGGIGWSQSLGQLIQNKGIIAAAEKNTKAIQVIRQLDAAGREPIISRLVTDLADNKHTERAGRLLASLGDERAQVVYDNALSASLVRIKELEAENAALKGRRGSGAV